MNFDGEIHSRPDQEFDYAVKAVVERNFPLEVVVDETNKTGYFKINEKYPLLEGTIFRFVRAFYDDVSNHMSFQFEVLSNPKNIPEDHPNLRQLLFHVLQVIYKLECEYILSKEANVNSNNN